MTPRESVKDNAPKYMKIFIKNDRENLEIDLKNIEKKAAKILKALKSPEGELSVLIVGDEKIAEINSQYLGRKGPTNVIAFSMREGEFSGINPDILGDVVISADTAEKEAKMSGTSFEYRFFELLIHGVLHLFGYDHEQSDKLSEKMEQKSGELLKIIDL